MEEEEGERRGCFINSHNVELDIDAEGKMEPRDLHIALTCPPTCTHL